MGKEIGAKTGVAHSAGTSESDQEWANLYVYEVGACFVHPTRFPVSRSFC